MPTKITVTGTNAGVLDYKYSADGIKLQKKKTQGGATTTTDYAGGYVYENGDLKQIDQPEGYIEPNGSSFQYVYRYLDIWGTTRITYADDDDNGSIDASTEIRREQNYYPFGLEHKGYNTGKYGVENNLKTYQKQEFTEDLGLNTHEWKYRMSDPAIGRFWQIDPLAEKYPFNATYAFQENTLGMGIELEGLENVNFKKVKYFKPNIQARSGPIFRGTVTIKGKFKSGGDISFSLGNNFKGSYGMSLVEGSAAFSTNKDIKLKGRAFSVNGSLKAPGVGESELSVAALELNTTINSDGFELGDTSLGTYGIQAVSENGNKTGFKGAVASVDENGNLETWTVDKAMVQLNGLKSTLDGNTIGLGTKVGKVTIAVGIDITETKKVVSNFFIRLYDLILNGPENIDP